MDPALHRGSGRGRRLSAAADHNAYSLQPPTQWRGYRAAPPPPNPEAGTWGDHPPLPNSLGAELALRIFPDDPFAAVLAVAQFSWGKYWVATIPERQTESKNR